MKLYKQYLYVRPHLEFVSPAWSLWQQGDKDMLKKVQEKAVKMVSGLKATKYLLRCAELNLDTLKKRREDQDMSLVHKLASESIFSNTNVLKLVGTGVHTATRIGSESRSLVTQYARTELRNRTEPWNKFPMEQKNANSNVF
jgi:ribonuclease P/MRP protein subunit RPP40